MKKKLVSIIVNCYNGEKYLLKALNSVLKQKYQNFELVFVDNYSTDSSAKLFKSIKDPRFKYYKTQKKINLYEARNYALKKCKGDFIAFLDSDDWWDKNFLSSKKKFFNSNKDYGFTFSNCFHYFENSKKLKIFTKKKLPSGFILDNLLQYYFVKLSTIILKKKLIKSYKFNPKYNIIGDYDFIIKIAQNYKAISFQDSLTYIRIHAQNFSHNNRDMFYKEFKDWVSKQNYQNYYFKKNKDQILKQLEYLRLIALLLNHKSYKLIFEILKFPIGLLKFKLLIIYFLPNFIIKLKNKYF